jgi:hypothetical protein
MDDTMMNKDEFWELIESSFREANWETDKQMEILIDKLSNYSEEEILKFGGIYDIYANESYKSKLWAAAYIMNGGCSDDCFDYFRGWLISRGEEAFLNALKNPDSIADLDIASDCDYFENEAMLSVALNAFIKNTGSDDLNSYFQQQSKYNLLKDEINDIVDSISFDIDINKQWDEEDDESLNILLPKLYALYW